MCNLEFAARHQALRLAVDAAIIAGRALIPRTPPRDRRGRFLSAAWLAQAETFTSADLSWFAHPVR